MIPEAEARRRWPRWSDALERAGEIRRQCQLVSPGSETTYTEPYGTAELEMWALPVYAIASEGYDVGTVSVAQLRHRLDDRDHYTMWLFGCLERIGHAVTPPTRPTALRGLAADANAVVTLLRAHTAVRDPSTDDPVVNRWTLATAITAESVETMAGATVDLAPGCELWWHRLRTVEQLDAVLVLERGGWAATTRVRTQGVPHYICPSGMLAAEAGVAPDRAVVACPVWDFNHEQGTLVEGPATRYYIRFRDRMRGVPTGEQFGPIPATSLALDLDPFPDTAATTIAALGARHRPGHTKPITHPTDPAGDTGVSEGGHDPISIPAVEADSGSLPRSMAATDDLVRARAIRRVWELRDVELQRVGDSKPHRVAQRIARGELPPPLGGMSSRDLALTERTEHPQELSSRLAPWCEPDRHLVTGTPREELIRWLEVMDHCTPRQRIALDGVDRTSTLDEVGAFLAAEGFVGVLEATTGPRHVSLILVNADAGWLAIVHAREESDRVVQPWAVRVYYNVAVLDDQLLLRSPGGYVRDHNGLRTNILYGHASLDLYHDRGQSLRLQLAVLRAFCRPVTPWMASPDVHIGPDDTPRAEQRRVLALLPQPVHDLFGPLLTPKQL